MHCLTRIVSCSECGGTSPGVSSTLPPPTKAAIADRVAAHSPRPLGDAVGRKWGG